MGFDTTYSAENIKEWKTKGHRVLLLPISEKKANEEDADSKKEGDADVKKEDEEEKEKPEAFWAIVSSDGTIVKARDKTWELSLHSYGPTSHAHDACAEILELVSSHAKAGPFMVPVDPEALNIPTYFDVIKHPMDLGTMQKKLDAGDYSINLPPPEGEDEYTIRSNSIQTMVYGPFYDDLIRIFDNATTFNPPGDWIHNEAVALKKAALKRLDQVFHRAVKEADREKTQAAKKEAKKSVYVEEDSDVDMYEYESDYDDDVGGAGSKRSRGRKKKKKPEKEEDNATKAIEAPIRLPRVSDTSRRVFSRLFLFLPTPRLLACRRSGMFATKRSKTWKKRRVPRRKTMEPMNLPSRKKRIGPVSASLTLPSTPISSTASVVLPGQRRPRKPNKPSRMLPKPLLRTSRTPSTLTVSTRPRAAKRSRPPSRASTRASLPICTTSTLAATL